MSVVLNTTTTSNFLRKKHSAIACHQVREGIAARIMRIKYKKRRKCQ
jgi:hypothetical protein